MKRLYKANFTTLLKTKNWFVHFNYSKYIFWYSVIQNFLWAYRLSLKVRVVWVRLEKIHQQINESSKAKGMLAISKELDRSFLGLITRKYASIEAKIKYTVPTPIIFGKWDPNLGLKSKHIYKLICQFFILRAPSPILMTVIHMVKLITFITYTNTYING